MFDFAEVAHIVHGDAVASGPRRLGASTLQVSRDLLTYGPCDADPKRHTELRLAHWQLASDRAGDFSLAVDSSSQPIVLWASRAWSDQLFFWHALDQLDRAGVEPSRLWWAMPVTHHPRAASGAAPLSELERALAQAQPIARDMIVAARELWLRFASPSPLAFDELRRAGSPTVPELASIAEPHGWWFPQSRDGQLRLSQMDELLLHVFDDEWRSPMVLLKGPRSTEITEGLFYVYGDSIVVSRLKQCADHGVLEYRQQDGAGWSEHAFRLTTIGARLRDEGLRSVAEMPAIFTGGCRTHDASRPFVRVVEKSEWRITTL